MWEVGCGRWEGVPVPTTANKARYFAFTCSMLKAKYENRRTSDSSILMPLDAFKNFRGTYHHNFLSRKTLISQKHFLSGPVLSMLLALE